MRSDMVLTFLVVMGSALSWLPICWEPSLELPPWIPLLCVAFCTGLSTALNRKHWPLFVLASGMGTFGGLCFSVAIGFPIDPIGRSYAPLLIPVITIIAVIGSLFASFVVLTIRISPATNRTALWVALLGVVAFGPVALSLTPP
jgi:hypothetical protein